MTLLIFLEHGDGPGCRGNPCYIASKYQRNETRTDLKQKF